MAETERLNVIAVGFAVLKEAYRDRIAMSGRRSAMLAFLGSKPEVESAEPLKLFPVVPFVAIARSAPEIDPLAEDFVQRQFGPDAVVVIAFVDLQEASASRARARLEKHQLQPGFIAEAGRPLLICDVTESGMKPVLGYTVDEYLTPHRAEEGIWFLEARAAPMADHADVQSIGGAYINAWVLAPFREDAMSLLERDLGKLQWRIDYVTSSAPAVWKTMPRESRPHYKQAKADGACYLIFGFPKEGSGSHLP